MALALVLSSAASSGYCQTDDKTTAEALFMEAKELMQAGRYDEACPKLADSQKLDPGIGTLLNLALCYKSLGRTASAWSTYREAAAAARAGRQEERETIARDEADALQKTLSRLKIELSPEVAQLDLTIARDGVVIPKSAWGAASPVDPGVRVVEVSAPGKKPWRTEIQVDPNGDSKTVVVPPLEDAPVVPAESTEHGASPDAAPAAVEDKGPKTRRTIGFVAGGVGIATIGVGAFFGIRALGLKSDSDDRCRDGECDAEGLSLYEDAQTSGLIADICYGVGAIGLGVGAYLVLTNGGFSGSDAPESARRPGWELGAMAGPRAQGVVLRNTW
jgi:hypothetical protein